MKEYLKPVFRFVMVICGLILIYGGIHGFVTLLRSGGFSGISGSITALIGTLTVLVILVIYLHDSIRAAIKTNHPPGNP